MSRSRIAANMRSNQRLVTVRKAIRLDRDGLPLRGAGSAGAGGPPPDQDAARSTRTRGCSAATGSSCRCPRPGENLVSGTTTIRTFNSTAGLQSQYVIGSGPGPHPGAPERPEPAHDPGQQPVPALLGSGRRLRCAGRRAADDRSGRRRLLHGEQPPTYTPIDCVAYGAFMATAMIPSAGPPAVATPFESTLERSIAKGCATALDAADDTNNSSADFALSTRPPRSNATAPTETLCPTPGGTTKPARSARRRRRKRARAGGALRGQEEEVQEEEKEEVAARRWVRPEAS